MAHTDYALVLAGLVLICSHIESREFTLGWLAPTNHPRLSWINLGGVVPLVMEQIREDNILPGHSIR